MSVGFNDPRVTLHICDGIKYVQDAAESSFDVIIVDSSDPVGPAEVLFEEPFFRALHRAVRPGGIVCTQVGAGGGGQSQREALHHAVRPGGIVCTQVGAGEGGDPTKQ